MVFVISLKKKHRTKGGKFTSVDFKIIDFSSGQSSTMMSQIYLSFQKSLSLPVELRPVVNATSRKLIIMVTQI